MRVFSTFSSNFREFVLDLPIELTHSKQSCTIYVMYFSIFSITDLRLKRLYHKNIVDSSSILSTHLFHLCKCISVFIAAFQYVRFILIPYPSHLGVLRLLGLQYTSITALVSLFLIHAVYTPFVISVVLSLLPFSVLHINFHT
jgi:hypothetical protein